MTPRQRLLETLAHRQADRVPLDFVCGDDGLRAMIDAADLADDVRDRFCRGDVDTVSFAERSDKSIFAPWNRDTPPEAEISDWGGGSLRHPDSGRDLLTMHLYYPLKGMTDPRQLDDYPWPDMTDPVRWGHLAGEIARSHAAGRAVMGNMSQTVAELCYGLRSAEQLYVDFYENPAFIGRLFDIITEARCEQARRFAGLGVDVLRIGDDLAMQNALIISPETYRQWIKPCHARAVDAARAVRTDIPVLYHSDGNVEEMVPHLIDIGVTAINPVQPECIDPAMVKRRWGDRLTIWGGASTQRTIAFGSEADVDAEVDACMHQLAPGGGYVANFINIAWSDTARRNLLRYLIGVQQRGTY